MRISDWSSDVCSSDLTGMGPSFIKLGQMLSTRADLLGEQVAFDLAELQDHLPPFDSARARRILEEEFGQPVEALFVSFDPVPVSAARSEEHTSELQSLMRISYAVFCLKKKTNRHMTKKR